MREKGSCRSQSGLKPPMKRCIQDGYCQKSRKNEKSAKIEAYLSLKTKTNNYFYCRTAKKVQNKKFIIKVNIKKTKKNRIKPEEKSK